MQQCCRLSKQILWPFSPLLEAYPEEEKCHAAEEAEDDEMLHAQHVNACGVVRGVTAHRNF